MPDPKPLVTYSRKTLSDPSNSKVVEFENLRKSLVEGERRILQDISNLSNIGRTSEALRHSVILQSPVSPNLSFNELHSPILSKHNEFSIYEDPAEAAGGVKSPVGPLLLEELLTPSQFAIQAGAPPPRRVVTDAESAVKSHKLINLELHPKNLKSLWVRHHSKPLPITDLPDHFDIMESNTGSNPNNQ